MKMYVNQARNYVTSAKKIQIIQYFCLRKYFFSLSIKMFYDESTSFELRLCKYYVKFKQVEKLKSCEIR